MGEIIKHTGNELRERWMKRMPPFFRALVRICVGIVATATSVNMAVPALGGTLYDWWPQAYTHILVGSICVMMVCKLTVAGGYKELDPDDLLRGKIDKHIQMTHDIDEQIDGELPGDIQE